MTNEQIQVISRLSKTAEGKEFLQEILKDGVKENHKLLLTDGKEHRDELIGYGCALSDLVGLFTDCDIRLAKQEEVSPEWM